MKNKEKKHSAKTKFFNWAIKWFYKDAGEEQVDDVPDVADIAGILSAFGFSLQSVNLDPPTKNNAQDVRGCHVTVRCLRSGLRVALESKDTNCRCKSEETDSGSVWSISVTSPRSFEGGVQEVGSSMLYSLTPGTAQVMRDTVRQLMAQMVLAAQPGGTEDESSKNPARRLSSFSMSQLNEALGEMASSSSRHSLVPTRYFSMGSLPSPSSFPSPSEQTVRLGDTLPPMTTAATTTTTTTTSSPPLVPPTLPDSPGSSVALIISPVASSGAAAMPADAEVPGLPTAPDQTIQEVMEVDSSQKEVSPARSTPSSSSFASSKGDAKAVASPVNSSAPCRPTKQLTDLFASADTHLSSLAKIMRDVKAAVFLQKKPPAMAKTPKAAAPPAPEFKKAVRKLAPAPGAPSGAAAKPTRMAPPRKLVAALRPEIALPQGTQNPRRVSNRFIALRPVTSRAGCSLVDAPAKRSPTGTYTKKEAASPTNPSNPSNIPSAIPSSIRSPAHLPPGRGSTGSISIATPRSNRTKKRFSFGGESRRDQ